MIPPTDVRAAYKAAPHLTHIELTWREGKIEHWLCFGNPADEQRIDRFRRIVSFAPDSTFAFVRWTSNDYGTVLSRIDIGRRRIDRRLWRLHRHPHVGLAGPRSQ